MSMLTGLRCLIRGHDWRDVDVDDVWSDHLEDNDLRYRGCERCEAKMHFHESEVSD